MFWNLKRNAIEDMIITCIAENNIDIAIFAEFDNIDFNKIEESLGKMYKRILGVQKDRDRKVTLIAKTTFDIKSIEQEKRYNIYNIETGLKKYILAAIHLEDRRNYETRDRLETIRDIMENIEQTEALWKCNNTIVIGDFNANPYDEELISRYAFNSVLFKTIINKNELRNPSTLKKKRFYNPILHYISEETEMYGSFYYENGSVTPYWYCLDQLLVRKELINSICHMEYLKRIDKKELLKNGIPDQEISDHLPLLVKLQEVGNGV